MEAGIGTLIGVGEFMDLGRQIDAWGCSMLIRDFDGLTLAEKPDQRMSSVHQLIRDAQAGRRNECNSMQMTCHALLILLTALPGFLFAQ
jgi:hypothetical protein